MEHIPLFISLAIMLTALCSVYIFYRAANKSTIVAIVLLTWLAIQAYISKTGFYADTTANPPHFALALVPPLVFIALLFITAPGRRFIDSLNIKTLTILHIVRIPVELVLLSLFMYKVVPQAMTFEGRNFDILSGLSAPLIYYFVFLKKQLSHTWLLLWNIICLLLLVNIVATAILAAPFGFQQIAFDQPNIAILYFPFAWLPACIVPIVLFSHLATIRWIWRNKTADKQLAMVSGH